MSRTAGDRGRAKIKRRGRAAFNRHTDTVPAGSAARNAAARVAGRQEFAPRRPAHGAAEVDLEPVGNEVHVAVGRGVDEGPSDLTRPELRLLDILLRGGGVVGGRW